MAFEDISRDEMALLESEKNDLPGVGVQAVAHRNYPHGSLAAHMLGYMNQITPEELADRRQRADSLNYHNGDYIGRAGLERQWESFLRGKDGVERIIVDAKGQRKDSAELESLARRAAALRAASRATIWSRRSISICKRPPKPRWPSTSRAPPPSSRSTPAACSRWPRGPSPIPTCSPAG